MNEPTDDITKEYVDGCGYEYDPDGAIVNQVKVRVMSPFEIKQRLELNVANTASALRAKVVAATSKSNGHQNAENLSERCLAKSELGYRCTLKIGHFGAHLSSNDYEF